MESNLHIHAFSFRNGRTCTEISTRIQQNYYTYHNHSCEKMSPLQDWRSTLHKPTFLPTLKSRDTKDRPNIKDPARLNLDTVPLSKNQWSVASSLCKWQRRQLLKTARYPTLKGLWLWPWIGSYCILSCITQHAKISLKSKKCFVDGRTCGHLRPALLSHGYLRPTLLKSRPNN